MLLLRDRLRIIQRSLWPMSQLVLLIRSLVQQVMDIFTKLNAEGTTIVMVTHEEEVAAYSSRRIVLRDGKITEDRRCAV